MDEFLRIGKSIKEKRLEMNLRMDDVAKKANITRVTLWSIEKGTANCSIKSLFRVLNVLNLKMSFSGPDSTEGTRSRASRTNTLLAKKKNRFVIMCIEQYAASVGLNSGSLYVKMQQKGLLDELEADYEDLHGMSTMYLNDYIGSRLGSIK